MFDAKNKIKSIQELAETVGRLRGEGKVVAQCHGVFDLLHPGHIRHLQAAKRDCDVLVVTLTTDGHVNKGPGRPAFNQALRAEALAALGCVDYVAISQWPTAVEAIHALKPNLYVKGSEYADAGNDVTGKIRDEELAIHSVGGRLLFTDDITFSSSQLINANLNIYPPETEAWLADLRSRYSIGEVLELLDRAAELKVLVVGEAIIDEYVFCDGLGKSNKDPMLAFLHRSLETYAGGSLAVANHLAGICGEVGLITVLGEEHRRESFIREALAPNAEAYFVTQPAAPTIHKRRFVDAYTGTRLFEIYEMDDTPLADDEERLLIETIAARVPDYDLVVVTDYGHGMMTTKTVAAVVEHAPFLALNTQANAGNRGFNTISKYPRADYVSLATHEVALETRMRHAAWEDLLDEVSRRIDCPNFTVTRGKAGTTHFHPGSEYISAPALATRISDRVGAGDAVFAVTSLLVRLGAPWELVGFLGNLAGAEMVGEIGNRNSVSRASLAKQAQALLK
ncbi:MAG: PfkB family carbohydrate kinase [Gammaproteobacteria bacterium SHHR-1]